MAQKSSNKKQDKLIPKIEEALQTTYRIENQLRCGVFCKAGRLISFFGSICGLLIPILTIYLSFSNFISIDKSASLGPNDPLTTPFIIKNESLIDLKNLRIDSQFVDVIGETEKVKNLSLKNVHILTTSAPLLEGHKSYTMFFQLGKLINQKFKKIVKADIQINIIYDVLVFKNRKQSFRFIAVPFENGITAFYPDIPKE